MAAQAADNVLANPSFEFGTSPWTADGNWQLDTTVARTGSNSFRCTGSGSSAMTTLNIIPGGTYTLTGWLRTSGISSDTRAAYLCVEWYTGTTWTDGVYINLNGSDNWQQFIPRSFSIPASATRVVMGIGMNNGLSGTVWFDDLELNSPVYLYSQMLYPPYRDTLFSNMEKKLDIGVKATGNTTYPLSACSVVIDVEDALRQSLLHASGTYDISRDWSSYEFSLPSLADGAYTVSTRLVYNPGNTTIATYTRSLEVDAPSAALPKVYLDEYGRLVSDGQLFFPLGIYTSTDWVTAVNQMDMMKEAKLNTQFCTATGFISPENGAAYLNAAAGKGIKVLINLVRCLEGIPNFPPPTSFGSFTGTPFEVMQRMVTAFKDYPALLAWYTDDELDAENFFTQIRNTYNYIKSVDSHPAVGVLVPHQNLNTLATMCDILGTDYYPVYGAGAGAPDYWEIGNGVKKARSAVMRSKGVWTVIETPRIDSDTQIRTASYEEILNECYTAIVHGTRGIVFFYMNGIVSASNSAELWQIMVRVGTHLDGLKSIALGVDAPADQSLTVSNSAVNVLTRVLDNGDIYAMAVNPYPTPAQATFTLGAGLSVPSLIPVGLPGVTERFVTVAGRNFSDDLEPLGTRIYCLHSSGGTPETATVYPGEAGKPLMYPLLVTPNHDGKNDHLQIRYASAPGEKMILKVFDLCGLLVYERKLEGERIIGNNEYLAMWDGNDFNGSAVPQGLYLAALFKGDQAYLKRVIQVLR